MPGFALRVSRNLMIHVLDRINFRAADLSRRLLRRSGHNRRDMRVEGIFLGSKFCSKYIRALSFVCNCNEQRSLLKIML